MQLKIAEKYSKYNIYIPEKIGCGLAGGNWELVKNEIKNLKLSNLYFLNTYTFEIEISYDELKKNLKVENSDG